MNAPVCLCPAMAEELSQQIKEVKAGIAKLVLEIDEVKAELKVVDGQLKGEGLTAELRAELVEREKRLGAEKLQLGARVLQLGAEKQILLKTEPQPGAARCFPAVLSGLVSAWRQCLAYVAAEPAAE